jgi:3-deoxy-manno-octulosonate cytidylyltransferase (CMP-KDO synthetase)
MFRVVIPARYGSTRLPGKALIELAGKPMVQWVYERARSSRASDVVIATDDERIAQAAARFDAPVVMTAVEHASGTDRIAEVARLRGWHDADIVVNVQGDEPLIPSQIIDQVAALLVRATWADLATLSAPLRDAGDYFDPSVVKVVASTAGRALYFSRAPVPWDRDASAEQAFGSWQPPAQAQRHLGIYAYRIAALRRLAALPQAELESVEKLEQLRALANGMAIAVELACEAPPADVNTPADVERAARWLRPI